MPKLISKSAFSRLAGISPQSVTKLAKGRISDAVVGGKIDVNRKSVKDYLKDSANTKTDDRYQEAVDHCNNVGKHSAHEIAFGLGVNTNRAKTIHRQIVARNAYKDAPDKAEDACDDNRGDTESSDHGLDIDVASAGSMTLNEIMARFPTDQEYVEYFKALKLAEEIQEKRLKNAEKAGELISRDLVASGIIATIDGAFIRMLTDGAKTISVRALAMSRSGADEMGIENLIRSQLSTFIKPTKSKIKRVLSNA